MKLYSISLLLLLTSSFAFAQEENYFIKMNGERVKLFKNNEKAFMHVLGNNLEGQLHLTANQVFYYNEKGKQKLISQKKVKEMHFEGKSYINLPITLSTLPRLHEVIASNEKYILTQYFHNRHYLYIYEKQEMKPLLVQYIHSQKKEFDLKVLDNEISKYFSDCPELISRIKTNIENADYKKRGEKNGEVIFLKNILLSGISSFECK